MICSNCGEDIEIPTRIASPIPTDLTMEEKYLSSYVYHRIDSKVLREYVKKHKLKIVSTEEISNE